MTLDADTSTAVVKATPDDDPHATVLSSAMPEVQNHAIEEFQRQQAESAAAATPATSGKPAKFDPAIHCADADGKPKLNRDGTFRLRPGRKNGASAASGSKLGSTATATKDDATLQARATGVALATIITNTTQQIFGNEWKPIQDTNYDEKGLLENATADYCAATGAKDIPPGWALLIVWSGYALARFQMPVTKSKLQKIKEWVFLKIAKRKALKAARQKEADHERL